MTVCMLVLSTVINLKMDKVMTFSFQNPRAKKGAEYLRRCEELKEEINNNFESRKSRSKSSIDMHSLTTAEALHSNSSQSNRYQPEVMGFMQRTNDPFTQSLNQIVLNKLSKETQTEGPPKLQMIQEQVNGLQQQKEEILHQIRVTMKENQQYQSRNKQLESENLQLRQMQVEFEGKEKLYEQKLTHLNW